VAFGTLSKQQLQTNAPPLGVLQACRLRMANEAIIVDHAGADWEKRHPSF
jgi:hypothetical protein